MLQYLLILLPLGIDTLGISISLGIKSTPADAVTDETRDRHIPYWLSSALLFSLAETVMPLVGLAIGYAASLAISSVMQLVGPLLLIAVGLWELVEELSERYNKRKLLQNKAPQPRSGAKKPVAIQSLLVRQLFLALSVSLDELAVGFSLGSISVVKNVNPLTLCILIGLQGFLMAVIGIALGRTLRTRLSPVKDWSELLSGVLLIGLGVWLLVT